jgi:hypothetical protein
MTNLTTMPENYEHVRTGIVELLKAARSAAARNVNSIMTATYWEIGRRIVTLEQGGEERAEYGEQLIEQLARDLIRQFGRGFGRANLRQMRAFYRAWPESQIRQTLSGEFATSNNINALDGTTAAISTLAPRFALPWSAYVRMLSVKNPEARAFYESEALRAGWSVRQLDRQIDSQFYERIALSKNKAAMLEKAQTPESTDTITPEEAIKDPFVLEFLDLKDEYSESDLEEALIEYFDAFLIGLTATPDARTYGFFKKNIVSEYSHERAVADGVNVGNEVYRTVKKVREGVSGMAVTKARSSFPAATMRASS